MEIMLNFFYTHTLDLKGDLKETTLTTLARIYAIADRFAASFLGDMAKSKFNKALTIWMSQEPDMEDLLESVNVIYKVGILILSLASESVFNGYGVLRHQYPHNS